MWAIDSDFVCKAAEGRPSSSSYRREPRLKPDAISPYTASNWSQHQISNKRHVMHNNITFQGRTINATQKVDRKRNSANV